MIKGKFAGYETNGVIVAASSPATESVERVLRCQENGAAAVILKTASQTRIPDVSPRRCLVRNGLFWAKSSFNREILTLEQGEALVTGCKRANVTIPVAASVTELTLEEQDWLRDCERMEAAGADAVQLDFFYVENMLMEPNFETRFVALLRKICDCVGIPVMPKLNIALPAAYATHLLKQAGIRYVSLLDSIKTPTPVFVDWYEHSGPAESIPRFTFERNLSGGGLSVFGSFMLPITAQYVETISRAGFEVCAGGGVTDGGSASNLLLLGASSVQVATDVLLNGYQRFSDLNKEIELIDEYAVSAYLQGSHGDLKCFHELGGSIRRPLRSEGLAKLCSNLCEPSSCDQTCVRQAFCDRVCMEGTPIFKCCEGCRLCAALCPRQAIRLL